jgi:hypothetical protein
MSRRWPDVPVAQPGQRLNEPRIVGRVVKRFAEPFDGAVYTVLEVDESILWPESFPQFFPRDNFTLVLK